MALPVMPFLRLARAGFVMAREGVFGLVSLPDLPAGPRFAIAMARLLERRSVRNKRADLRLSDALNKLGPSYVKLGQFLATRADVVGKEAARELSALQDRLPAFDHDAACAAVAEQLGKPLDEVFVSFGEAVAAASIAQVHPAVILDQDGTERKVAVKVLRPGVSRRFQRDLESYYLVARLAERFHPPSRRLRPVAVVDTLAQSVAMEMDFRLEAAALSEMAENTADDPGFRVPAVEWLRTAKGVLTMEWIDGRKMSDVEGLKEDGHDLEALGAAVIQSFLRHTLRDGFFHADMHQGNLFVEPDGTLVAVDFGIIGRLNKRERRFLAEILFGFITRNYRRVAEVHFEAGYVPAHQDVDMFAQAIRAIGEPIHGHDASEISMARLLTQLFEVTELFEMSTQTQLIMLQKTMVVVEGVARSLNPNLDMWRTAEPVVGTWIKDNLGPVGKLRDAGDALSALARIANDMPLFADRIGRMSEELERMTQGGLRFDDETAEAIGRAEARHTRSGRVALWVIAACAVVATYMLF
ncbi:2-polyprenylphenol 6-hydroxylase [Roseibium algicola]|uniref:2-polyprenylphenol 6-hydroxylase n=1 Tax=Roseibium algicola TaxID=2857014 RepID=A0ABM6I0X4_9HYPH|nr:2-polyprenylphenol 6-hydroxylase [Roseibium aggregatum]MEC9417739.1 2-polyprenylphenol 6-hydroxylase [Pseudomonadota bacterium]AQQ03828.1 2-polyprenylphenol 6-hydroxylase [Roseibium aggregatum]MEC9470559.1 2-polyprenylphenol 6-hydroxylase [Pseudomonadota bacterium]MEE2868080.1 2-polyprenylphenol 6-hydroxylase [Pseudomonadota bacterium]UES48298.1 2-polyprenylphenol 6-hydroxylase [Roseibium aggregatum]